MLNADTREFEFKSDFDGLNISAFIAKPSGNINGIVQIVHGMNEHKEMYFDFMDYLAEEGFITVIHDNRGHGKSICTPDDLGFMFRNGSEGFVSDISQFTNSVRSAYPSVPYFIIGQGMGALGVITMLKGNCEGLNGVLLLGCPCYSGFSGFLRTIGSVSVQNPGSRTRSDKIFDAMEKSYGKNFGDGPRAWLSTQKDYVSSVNSDPLCNFNYTLNGYEEFLELMLGAFSKKDWDISDPSLPIRFISGRDDPCMISERKFRKVMDLLDRAGYESVSHRLFDGMRHSVLNEKNSINVYKDIAKTLYSWIDRANSAPAEVPQQTPETAEEAPAQPNAPAETAPPSPAEETAPTQEKKQPVHTSQLDVFEILESVRASEEEALADIQETAKKG